MVPLDSAMGDLPSFPPPDGNVVSLAAARSDQGMAGWHLSAMKTVSYFVELYEIYLVGSHSLIQALR